MSDDWIACDLSTLPDSIDFGGANYPDGYSFGTDVFGKTGRWMICDNGEPTRVWLMPRAVHDLIEKVRKDEYERGRRDVQRELRSVLNIKD